MRAFVVDQPGPPEVLRPHNLPVPEPGPGQVRVRVAFVGMNPVDALVRREKLPWMPLRYPFTPGLEHSGVVDAVGEGVDPVWRGRAVLSRLSFGGYADYSIAPVAGLIELPPGIDLLAGCVFRGCSYTAWHALHRVARVAAGERVLVHSAAGAVGIMALQIAAAAGASAVALCGGPGKFDWVRRFHAGPVVDYLADDWPARALEASGGARFDVILDGNGGEQALRNYELVARLGRVVYLGAMSGRDAPPVPVATLVNGSFSVAGMTLRQVEDPAGSDADRALLESIAKAVVTGRWRLPVSEVVPLADVAELHRRLEARELVGRAVIEVGGLQADLARS
jgi:NADPH2:quinone reductase